MSLSNHQSVKKTYHSPNLFAYGDIRDLTQTSNTPPQQLDALGPPAAATKTGFSM